ncbi:MAG: hypothetical protein D6765_00545 [Bacteroidetes bacterium]|nr:MAG: hypothetical protein D6765_00545 [Bacteroidota bacterium]
MPVRSVLFLVFLMLLALQACKHDSLMEMPDDEPPPDDTTQTPCDTTVVRFSADIFPIIQANCFTGCHNGDNPTSGFTLESYAEVKQKVDEGRFRGAVFREPGFVPMPFGKPPLPDCELAKIAAWLNRGAKND